MQVESFSRDPVELLQATFSETPEAFDAVDVTAATHELIVPMIDSEVFTVPDINQAIVAAPAITMDDRLGCHATANNRLQSGFLAVRHDLGIDAAISFEDAEDNGLARGTATAPASDTTSTEVGLINLDFTTGERRSPLALLGDALSDFEKDRVDGLVSPVNCAVRLAVRSRAK